MTFRLAFAVAIATVLAGGGGMLAGNGFWSPGPDPEAADAPVSGMALLNGYRCRRGETRRIVVKGVEDGFSPDGLEPSHRHERLLASLFDGTGLAQASYDQTTADGYVLDYFELPRNVGRALFVISLKPVADDRNDSLMIGDPAQFDGQDAHETKPIFYMPTSSLASLKGWRRSGPLAWAQFVDIRLRPGVPARGIAVRSLLDHVRSDPAQVFDVRVSDDTAVDFMGVAYCEEPATHGGLTVSVVISGTPTSPPVLTLATFATLLSHRGDPFLGDTGCDQALPLACFRDEGRPAPGEISHFRSNGTYEDRARHWTGGSLRLSSPVRGNAFATVAEADQKCRQEFGSGWRVADFHASGAGNALVGYGSGGAPGQRAWVDIKDQPYGTCWKRAEG